MAAMLVMPQCIHVIAAQQAYLSGHRTPWAKLILCSLSVSKYDIRSCSGNGLFSDQQTIFKFQDKALVFVVIILLKT